MLLSYRAPGRPSRSEGPGALVGYQKSVADSTIAAFLPPEISAPASSRPSASTLMTLPVGRRAPHSRGQRAAMVRCMGPSSALDRQLTCCARFLGR